jgi:hypothetical protein
VVLDSRHRLQGSQVFRQNWAPVEVVDASDAAHVVLVYQSRSI